VAVTPLPPDSRGPRRLSPSVLATCVVPWDETFSFAEDDFRAHVAMMAASMTNHLYIFGTAGEGHAVTEKQFRHIADAFADESARHGVTPMLGVVGLSLGTVLERIEYGLTAGYRQFQISFPAWGRLSDPECDLFFDTVCGRFPEAAFLHYNTPRGGRVLAGAEYGRLAARHPNLVALKFTSGDPDVVREVVRGCWPMQCFFTEPAYAIARRAGEQCGLLVSLSGVRPDLPGRLLAASGAELDRLDRLFGRVHALLLECLGDAAAAVHMDGAFEKIIARAHGAAMPLRLLPPFAGADEVAFRRFRDGLAELLEGRSGVPHCE
jgi:dihydrodipicolinate synthase/N-acetylneuraminate lyase